MFGKMVWNQNTKKLSKLKKSEQEAVVKWSTSEGFDARKYQGIWY